MGSRISREMKCWACLIASAEPLQDRRERERYLMTFHFMSGGGTKLSVIMGTHMTPATNILLKLFLANTHLTVIVLLGDCLLCLSTSICVNVACLMVARWQLFLPTTCAKIEDGIVIFLVLLGKTESFTEV